MAYESPEYKVMTDEIWRLEKIKGFVDLAREFAHMKYKGKMIVSCAPSRTPYDPSEPGTEVDVPDYLKAEIIKIAVELCVAQAAAIESIERKDFKIERCISI